VTGPAGTAVVASAPNTGHQGGRALANTWATLTRETGLTFPSTTAQNPAQDSEARPVARETRVPAGQSLVRQPREGAITRWTLGDTYGFITDSDGVSWFVSRDSLPGGRAELPEGTPVTFSGSPKPKPGKGYPEAVRVRIKSD
jgi:hypothetical protein